VFATYLAVGMLAVQVSPPFEHIWLMLFIDTALYCVFIWAVLKSFNQEKRIPQTATALFGTDTLLNIVSLPLLSWTQALEAAGVPSTTPQMFLLLLLFWGIDIAGHILSRAIGRPYVFGVFIVIGYVLLSTSLRISLFPPSSD
jgi:hypothetical protein